MEMEKGFILDLLQTEIDRIAATNPAYLKLEKDRQEVLMLLKEKLSRSEYELIEKLVDVTEIQNFLMIRSVLRIGTI